MLVNLKANCSVLAKLLFFCNVSTLNWVQIGVCKAIRDRSDQKMFNSPPPAKYQKMSWL